MDNPFDQMRAAVLHAREVQRAVESQAGSLAMLLEGNMRHVSPHLLVKLKRELRDFNMHTGLWKD